MSKETFLPSLDMKHFSYICWSFIFFYNVKNANIVTLCVGLWKGSLDANDVWGAMTWKRLRTPDLVVQPVFNIHKSKALKVENNEQLKTLL